MTITLSAKNQNRPGPDPVGAHGLSQTAEKIDFIEDTATPDPLVACLLMLARQHGLPASEFAATAGLPLEGGRLLPSQFDRAARRVGLRARVVRRGLSDLDALVTPAVLLLADDRACLLLEPLQDGAARLLLPENPEAEVRLPQDELAGLYSGFAILASPTATTMTVSVRAASDRVGAIEFGREGETIRETTDKIAMKAGVPTNFTLDGLAADRGYVYRFLWWTEEGDGPSRGEERRFHTPRAAGSAFTFVVQADSHLDQGVTPEAYAQTLANMAAARPDFLVDLGDTFMTGKRGQDFERAESQYDAQRHYFGLACDAMPLFMVLGNHDGETGSASGEIAAWSYHERTSRFPPPAIDGVMYTGATAMRDGRGANHYAFEWGDALFVVLDPFWPTAERSRGGGGRSGRDVPVLGFEDSSWSRTLGRSQYDWLVRTLAASDAPQKFVFVHHLVGGRGGNEARGGVESATSFEWGGRNADGSEGFASRRPGWPMPIHDLLVEHGVTAVFHGHDHLYVHAMLDGIHYQCVPQPGNLGGNTRSAAEYGYASGTILGSPGHLRISIAGDATATVEFVRTAIEGEAAPGSERRRRGGAAAEANGAVVDRYEIAPRRTAETAGSR